ncbi:hypothetical protein GCM10010345_94830 [Streptomyces canarius]|uniref:Uncharacterized protein n=1 Tax=Streptomyces canarius TaxID=285453 RepID=A0ABQ3DC97_9ACTN|nr:hypothetical protein GCM10010345_94830 [Streptomyces canarius]
MRSVATVVDGYEDLDLDLDLGLDLGLDLDLDLDEIEFAGDSGRTTAAAHASSGA